MADGSDFALEDSKIANRDNEARIARWVQMIRADPILNTTALKLVRNSLERLMNEYHGKPSWSMQRPAMEFLCEAIRNGAFSGVEWMPWRTRLADRPNIINAAYFLSGYAPELYKMQPHVLGHELNEATATQIIINVLDNIVYHNSANAVSKLESNAISSVNKPPPPINTSKSDNWYSSRWFGRHTKITSEQLRQEKFKGRLRAKKSKGQNLYSHDDAIQLWGEDALPDIVE